MLVILSLEYDICAWLFTLQIVVGRVVLSSCPLNPNIYIYRKSLNPNLAYTAFIYAWCYYFFFFTIAHCLVISWSNFQEIRSMPFEGALFSWVHVYPFFLGVSSIDHYWLFYSQLILFFYMTNAIINRILFDNKPNRQCEWNRSAVRGDTKLITTIIM